MKTINIISIISSTMWILSSLLQSDWTEAIAWFCVLMYVLRDYFTQIKK
jgi:hypothetical protein